MLSIYHGDRLVFQEWRISLQGRPTAAWCARRRRPCRIYLWGLRRCHRCAVRGVRGGFRTTTAAGLRRTIRRRRRGGWSPAARGRQDGQSVRGVDPRTVGDAPAGWRAGRRRACADGGPVPDHLRLPWGYHIPRGCSVWRAAAWHRLWLTRRSRTAAWCTQCCWKVRWRSQDLKLNFYADDASELYDLAEDPGEIVNRYDDPAYRNRPQELLEEDRALPDPPPPGARPRQERVLWLSPKPNPCQRRTGCRRAGGAGQSAAPTENR